MKFSQPMGFGKTIVVACILALGLAGGVYYLGSSYAEEATRFHADLQTVTHAAIKDGTIPDDYKPEEPSGFLAKMFVRHPNNEIVKGLAFALDADGFAEAHPNNEVAKAYSVLTNPERFIEEHPNNQLAHTLQILMNTKGFYESHPNNELGKTLHVILDPDDFIEKHPSNELGKALQVVSGDISGFRRQHPNNEITRALDSIENPKERLRKWGIKL